MALYNICVITLCLIGACASKVEHVENLNFEPRVAIQCGEVPQHIDTNIGKWVKGEQEFCPKDASEILQYCRSVFPDIDVTNVVESNFNVTLCDDDYCEKQITVIPYRCLIGKFEADALVYSPEGHCVFGYVHENQTCESHDYWKNRGVDVCKDKGKKLDNYGVLLACGINLYTGVEYVCCQEKQTPIELFKELLKDFSSHIPTSSKDCDRSQFESKQRAFQFEKRKKVKRIVEELQEAKDRMELLKQDDPQQAKSMYKDTINTLQSQLENIKREATLNEAQIHQGRRECIQISANHKKHMAMRNFVQVIHKHGDNPIRLIKAFKAVLRSLDRDQAINARFLSRLMHSQKSLSESARKRFGPHFELLRTTLKQSVDLLKHFDDVRGKIDFELPAWAKDIDFRWAREKIVEVIEPPTTAAETTQTIEPEALLPEDEHDDKHRDDKHPMKSRNVFAAVIGSSCGALVIMVVIVLALLVRKRDSARPTKTVVAEDETQEKRHLLNMQEDGFENPTYKFFVH